RGGIFTTRYGPGSCVGVLACLPGRACTDHQGAVVGTPRYDMEHCYSNNPKRKGAKGSQRKRQKTSVKGGVSPISHRVGSTRVSVIHVHVVLQNHACLRRGSYGDYMVLRSVCGVKPRQRCSNVAR